MLNHLVDIERLNKDEIIAIIDKAGKFKNSSISSQVQGKTVSLIFCENSTRTRCSFELAAKKLGINVINFDTANSSLTKGESLKDTIENLYFIGVDAVIIRHSFSGIIDNTSKQVKYPISFINAGDGNHSHPTQALLDFYTMLEKTDTIAGKKIAIIGDVKHSRVAKSNISLLKKFEADIHLCAPSYFRPENYEEYPVQWHYNIKDALKDADFVMVLRVQNERHQKGLYPDVSEYKKYYEVDSELLKKYAPDAVLMHPGPANRNIEVSSELLDGNIGETILEQAQNGVFIRMAVLDTILSQKEISYAS